MYYPKNVEKYIKSITNQRFYEEQHPPFDKQVETQYSLFSVWCRVNGENVNDVNSFHKYVKKENPDADWVIRKTIREKYFGEKFEYDYKKQKYVKV